MCMAARKGSAVKRLLRNASKTGEGGRKGASEFIVISRAKQPMRSRLEKRFDVFRVTLDTSLRRYDTKTAGQLIDGK